VGEVADRGGVEDDADRPGLAGHAASADSPSCRRSASHTSGVRRSAAATRDPRDLALAEY
jgi:hypothetical protein